MGHATVEMAFRYTHATEHGKRAAVEAARIARSGVCHNPATNDQRPGACAGRCKWLILLVAGGGIEPPTLGL
jgi:hypothetical protein